MLNKRQEQILDALNTIVKMYEHFEKIESCLASCNSLIQLETIGAMIKNFESRWESRWEEPFKTATFTLSVALHRKLKRTNEKFNHSAPAEHINIS